MRGKKIINYYDSKTDILRDPTYKAKYKPGDYLYVRETWCNANKPEGFRSWSMDKQDDWIKSTARATYIGWIEYADGLINAMQTLWDSTIQKDKVDEFGWNANPWVWVIEFEKVEV